MTEEEKTISEGVSLPSEKKDPKEQLQEQLQQGIKNVLDSDNFKSWLDTSSKLFSTTILSIMPCLCTARSQTLHILWDMSNGKNTAGM